MKLGGLSREVRAGMTVLLMGLLGIIVGGMVYVLYETGIVVDEYITGSIQVEEVMAIFVLVFLLLGGVIAVIRH